MSTSRRQSTPAAGNKFRGADGKNRAQIRPNDIEFPAGAVPAIFPQNKSVQWQLRLTAKFEKL
jgi:hypothetical protein